jgi:hypothetical protein
MSRHTHKRKSCEASWIAGCVDGKCVHVQHIHDVYGIACAYPAKNSVVAHDTEPNSHLKHILRVCDKHFEQMQVDDLLIAGATECCIGTKNLLRLNFRRNRL